MSREPERSLARYRPGARIENGYIQSFTGRLRDECLKVEILFSLIDSRQKLAAWNDDYMFQSAEDNERLDALLKEL